MNLESLTPATCDCGLVVLMDPAAVPPSPLCGRPHNKVRTGPIPKDLTGERFGLWLVVGRYEWRGPGQWIWICRCTGCDKLSPVWANNLRSKMSSGCASCRSRGRSDRVSP